MSEITKIGSAGLNQLVNQAERSNAKVSFESALNDAIGKVSQLQDDVEKAISELSSGGDITTAIIAAQKADMSFQLMVEVRNKLINAYEEVMRMQV